jgi:deoxycytidylate deaminase
VTLIEPPHKYFRLAAKFALRSDHTRHRMGAVLIKNGRLINWGINHNRTHPRSDTYFRSLHAELDAVIGVPREVMDAAQLYVIRLTKKGTMGTSKPCVACAALLESLNLKSVTYIDVDGTICTTKL